MMLTVLGQQGDYYNKWRYDGEPVDSEEFKEAINGLKKYFDEGIFSADVLDLDYASATEEFTNGDALVYYMLTKLYSISLRQMAIRDMTRRLK